MVILGFPNPKIPTNSDNRVKFSELQTQNYDLTQIQANISTYTRNLTNLLSQKDNYLMLANNQNIVQFTTATTNGPLILDKVTQDLNETYNLSSGTFMAPQDAVYVVSLFTVATVTSGAPTALFFEITSSQTGEVDSYGTSLIGTSFYFSTCLPIQLSAGSTLSFDFRGDTTGFSLNLSQHTRLLILWK